MEVDLVNMIVNVDVVGFGQGGKKLVLQEPQGSHMWKDRVLEEAVVW